MRYVRKFLNWYSKLTPGRKTHIPPYSHVVQVGDPTLRKVSESVPVDKMKSEEIQKVVGRLHHVLIKHYSVGMSAPQIGINLRIFVMMVTKNQLSAFSQEVRKLQDMTIIPLTIFINPGLKVLDYQKVTYAEGCESIKGYAAEVSRYKAVEISGYNENGDQHSQKFTGWGARIAQHEMDHLDGKLYTDLMDRKTLHCTCWEEVNFSRGKVLLPFTPE